MASLTSLPPRWDPFGPQLRYDPYPTYAQLRASGAVCRAGPATYAVTRYAEMATLLRDHRVGHEVPVSLRDQFHTAPTGSGVGLPSIVSILGPPEHTRIRKLMRKALNPALLHRMRELVTARADELITTALEHGRLDVVADLAVPLQVTLACELVGVPDADRADICRRAMALGRALILLPFVHPDHGSGDAEAASLRAYMADLIAYRRRHRTDDLVTSLVEARDGDQALTDDEIADNLVFLYFAGFETSIHMVANAVATLLRFPDQLARLRSDRSLLPTAVEEILRYDAPIQWVARMTSAPVVIDGRTIRAGRFLLLLVASANRDERQFTRPDRLDIGRHPNPHLSFAGGAHHCLGVMLARSQGAAVLDRLLERSDELAFDGEPELRPHPNLRGYARLPVALRRL